MSNINGREYKTLDLQKLNTRARRPKSDMYSLLSPNRAHTAREAAAEKEKQQNEAKSLADKQQFAEVVKIVGYYGTKSGRGCLQPMSVDDPTKGAGLLFANYDQRLEDVAQVTSGQKDMAWLRACYGTRQYQTKETRTSKKLARLASCRSQSKLKHGITKKN